MKTKKTEQREAQINEVIELLKGEDPRSKPSYIKIDDVNGSFVSYPDKREYEITFDEAVSLHEKYPDVLTIQWSHENSPPAFKNPSFVIDFRHD